MAASHDTTVRCLMNAYMCMPAHLCVSRHVLRCNHLKRSTTGYAREWGARASRHFWRRGAGWLIMRAAATGQAAARTTSARNPDASGIQISDLGSYLTLHSSQSHLPAGRGAYLGPRSPYQTGDEVDASAWTFKSGYKRLSLRHTRTTHRRASGEGFFYLPAGGPPLHYSMQGGLGRGTKLGARGPTVLLEPKKATR